MTSQMIIWVATWAIVLVITWAKGQLISKCLFGVFNSPKKMNENNLSWGTIVVKSNIFVHFLGKFKIPKRHFEINWPLASTDEAVATCF